MNKLWNQIWKFGIVGGFSFLVDFGVFALLSNGLQVHYLIANFFSFTISLIVNYLLSMKFVFVRKENADKRIEFIIFAVLSAIGLVLNEGIIFIWHDVVYGNIPMLSNVISENFSKLFGKIIATGIVMVYNFVTRKIFLEKKD